MMHFFLPALLLAIAGLSSNLVAAAKPTPEEAEKRRLATEVFKIFEAKCADCHGAHLPKPKGKFGYVLDLKRVADNLEYVVRGDPGESELYQLVKNDEMPGEDADVPPLTEEEKKTVERWVLLGAPHELLPASTLPRSVPDDSPAARPGLLRRIINWLGKFHPASTHFPVALLLTAVLAEGIAWWLKRDVWMLLVRFLVVLGALSSVPTAALGWMVDFPIVGGSQLANIYRIHQILGTATAGWAVVCALLVCMDECEEGSLARRRFRGALLLGAFLVGVVGFLGGALSSGGLDHYKF